MRGHLAVDDGAGDPTGRGWVLVDLHAAEPPGADPAGRHEDGRQLQRRQRIRAAEAAGREDLQDSWASGMISTSGTAVQAAAAAEAAWRMAPT